jgi:hypothetical protein
VDTSSADASMVGRLVRIRWAVRLVLTVGVCASVAANVLHAARNPISQAIAGWPPVALLLAVELVSRVPVHRRGLAVVRISATVIISGIAAWVSYFHMAAVAARYGEAGSTAYLLPVSVDGLIVVASVCLVELAHRITAMTAAPASVAAPAAAPGPAVATVDIPATPAVRRPGLRPGTTGLPGRAGQVRR